MSAVLLENIKLRSKVKRADQILRQKEELADGLHLIDFEQLKIENQTYNEKIEERNEDVQKLRRKLVTLVQMVTHLKEKLHFMQKQCTKLRANLDDMDRQVEELRDETPTLKRARDRLRKANLDLQHKNGLRGNRMLLLDYEKKVVSSSRILIDSIVGLTLGCDRSVGKRTREIETNVQHSCQGMCTAQVPINV